VPSPHDVLHDEISPAGSQQRQDLAAAAALAAVAMFVDRAWAARKTPATAT
jgi:hypothetical protein